ncbi:AN1-type zinc finger protein 3-like isoform X2 [Oncorhynchus keta]|uniref:AN1-type zinc finger protein 3-like isoform X2 n=1 Tax=Oncorhynchus keta TaxID=8018 RepID=UPI0015F8EABC|nr:AN1-type zinc finger protein 3-like isoform X2 [Oncorhynchus keta]
MGDTGSERSKPLPTRCPCGFWGSSKTMNLCSKCFAELLSCTETAQGTLCTPKKRPCESASGLESEASPEKRARGDSEEGEAVSEEPSPGPKQKNRRRCYRCQTKLELVQQELGSCRCGYVFCMLHRLPEQHDCLFDHLGRGREEAVLKMVKLDRKVGRSCQRIGEECS